ncbi:MAG TPA: hypothetical protein VKA67_06115, partial [Verrucomicrobiae bacterium]|nr:hypothetical protein [Verrucomicrobiae bacterium]
MREAAAICPSQHVYDSAELHLTVMAIITGTESWRREIRLLPVYRKILSDVLKNQHAFSVKFRGVTLTPDAVMIQGFPTELTLAVIRDQLRGAFRRKGFGEKLDRRYKIATAHLTAMRFSTPGENWEALLS